MPTQDVLVKLISDLGSLGFIFWLVHRTTTQTIPRLAKNFEDAVERQRIDFKEQAEKYRESFMELIREQRAQFFEELQREREFNEQHLRNILGTVQEQPHGRPR